MQLVTGFEITQVVTIVWPLEVTAVQEGSIPLFSLSRSDLHNEAGTVTASESEAHREWQVQTCVPLLKLH